MLKTSLAAIVVFILPWAQGLQLASPPVISHGAGSVGGKQSHGPVPQPREEQREEHSVLSLRVG